MIIKTGNIKWLTLSMLIITLGCDQNSFVTKQNSAEELVKIQRDKSAAAANLQSIIRNAYKVSVQHKGYEPKATPPCPAPEWKPQDILVVDEKKIWTKFYRQHWVDRREKKWSSGYWALHEWRAYKGGVTEHNVWIRFKDVISIKVDKPLFFRWIIVTIFYDEPSYIKQISDNDPKTFKVWFDKSHSKSNEYKQCLTTLKILCPHLEIND
jgi:hypothetical protein